MTNPKRRGNEFTAHVILLLLVADFLEGGTDAATGNRRQDLGARCSLVARCRDLTSVPPLMAALYSRAS
jgi:hypothetical protein